MDTTQGVHVLNLANSIIGVSILAMPYCFRQCGIVLSIILLIISSIISRLTCHFLLKSAIKARLRTFEFLAYHVFGSLGKLFVEIGLIGYLLGTCIAFFVVMGDLGPHIVAHMTETNSSDTLRTTILIALAFLCVLPLGLLRNIDSLSMVSTATIGFYACLVLKVMSESAPHLLLGDWYDNVEYWRPAGLLQCIPIFSMALFCQTQLFEIYQALPNASLDKMNDVVRLAVNICTCVYIFVGVFGYIALSHENNFSGNILLSFKPSVVTEAMKIGFVLSVAFSFPLVIFPCRASLYSLIYKPAYTSLHENTTYIPENKFRFLTVLIVVISLMIGVMIPSIELVLGLVGSTIGVVICVLFPATCFICKVSKNTNERILAQVMLFVGITVMVLGTYANLYAIEEVTLGAATERNDGAAMLSKEKPLDLMHTLIPPVVKSADFSENLAIKDDAPLKPVEMKEIRHEPPQPEEPVEIKKPDQPKEIKKDKTEVVVEEPIKKSEVKTDSPVKAQLKNEEVDAEAIKKEDRELLNEAKEQFQKQLEQLQKEKIKAVKDIEIIAKNAIEKIAKQSADVPNVQNKSESVKQNTSIESLLLKLPPLPLVLNHDESANASRVANNQNKAIETMTEIKKIASHGSEVNEIKRPDDFSKTSRIENKEKDLKEPLGKETLKVVENTLSEKKQNIDQEENANEKELQKSNNPVIESNPKVENSIQTQNKTLEKLQESSVLHAKDNSSINLETKSKSSTQKKDVANSNVDGADQAPNNLHRDMLSEKDYLRRKREALDEKCDDKILEEISSVRLGGLQLTRDLKSVPEE